MARGSRWQRLAHPSPGCGVVDCFGSLGLWTLPTVLYDWAGPYDSFCVCAAGLHSSVVVGGDLGGVSDRAGASGAVGRYSVEPGGRHVVFAGAPTLGRRDGKPIIERGGYIAWQCALTWRGGAFCSLWHCQ